MNIDKIKIGYYLNKNKKNLFELKHDSHFYQVFLKNVNHVLILIMINFI